ncbi:unnamed protein product [Calypogeia fissa]
MATTRSLTSLTFDCLSGRRYDALRHSCLQMPVTVNRMSQITTRSQAREQHEKESHDKELDDRAAHGETVVPGGTGGLSLAAQERLAAGRKAGGETRKKQILHEAYAELGKKADHHAKNSHPDGEEAK